MVVGMVVASCLLAGVYSSGMLDGARKQVGRKVGRRGVLRSLSSRQSRVDLSAARGAVLLSVMRMSLGEEGYGKLDWLPYRLVRRQSRGCLMLYRRTQPVDLSSHLRRGSSCPSRDR